MPVIIEEIGKPETRHEFDDEQVAACRQILLDGYAKENDVSKINRRNGFFMKVSAAVKLLDEYGFRWGAELDDEVKRWSVVWMIRKLTNPRKQRWPKFQPMFIEVF